MFLFCKRSRNSGVSENIVTFNTFDAFPNNNCLQFDGNFHIRFATLLGLDFKHWDRNRLRISLSNNLFVSAAELSDRQQEDSDSVVRGRMRGCPLSIYRGNFNSGPTLSVNVRQHNQYYYLFDIIVFYKTYNKQIQSYSTTSTRAHH